MFVFEDTARLPCSALEMGSRCLFWSQREDSDPMLRAAALGGTRCGPHRMDTTEEGKCCDANQRANPSSYTDKFNQRILVSSILHLPASVSVLSPSTLEAPEKGQALSQVAQFPGSRVLGLIWVGSSLAIRRTWTPPRTKLEQEARLESRNCQFVVKDSHKHD